MIFLYIYIYIFKICNIYIYLYLGIRTPKLRRCHSDPSNYLKQHCHINIYIRNHTYYVICICKYTHYNIYIYLYIYIRYRGHYRRISRSVLVKSAYHTRDKLAQKGCVWKFAACEVSIYLVLRGIWQYILGEYTENPIFPSSSSISIDNVDYS